MELGERDCQECGNKFQKVAPLQFLCSWECLNAYRRKKEKKKEDQGWKERKKVLKENTTTLPQLKKKLQEVINRIVRKIDDGNTCMMCDMGMRSTYSCHYHSVGSNDSLRFNLFNIWAGCFSCNGNKGGNIQGYDMQLLQKVGRENWEYVKFEIVKEYALIKLSREEIKELIVKARKIDREVKPMKRSTRERWRMRIELNKQIGIYV